MDARTRLAEHYIGIGAEIPAWLDTMSDEECRNIAKDVIGDEYVYEDSDE